MANQQVLVGGFGLAAASEGRDLDVLRAEENVHQAEAASDQPGVAKQLAHLMGMRRSADVEVLGPFAQHQVAHRAADQVGDEAGVDQPIEHLEDIAVDIAPRDRVLIPL